MLSRALVVLVAVASATAAFIDDPEELARQSGGGGGGNFLCSGWIPQGLQHGGCYLYCIMVQNRVPSSANVPCASGTCDCANGSEQPQTGSS